MNASFTAAKNARHSEAKAEKVYEARGPKHVAQKHALLIRSCGNSFID